MRGAYLCLALLALWATVAATTGQRCAVSSCSPSDPKLPLLWLNTSTTSSYVHGLTFRVYARMPSGRAFEKAYSEVKITNIREQQTLDGSRVCNKDDQVPEVITGNYKVLQDLDWSSMCCAASTSWEIIDGHSNRSAATITVTNPDYPDFIAKFHMFLVNETISKHVEGSPNTLNMDYDVTYSNTSQKLTFEMQNWPWVSKNATLNPSGWPSYVKFFLIATASLDEQGTIGYGDYHSYINYNASTSSMFLSLDFLKIITLDEVDYAMPSKVEDSVYSFLQGNLSYFSPPAIIVACRSGYLLDNPYWTNLTYDPTLLAVFSGEEFTPGQHRSSRLNPAAYAVPIVVVAVVLVVVAMILFVPAIRRKVLKRQTLAIPTLEDASQTRHTGTKSVAPATAASVSKPASAPKRNSDWVRSKEVDH